MSKHPECIAPEWTTGKILHFPDRVFRTVIAKSRKHDRAMVTFGWPDIESALEASGVPNVELDTNEWWYAYNSSTSCDYRVWKATLGKRAPLYNILRYYWNRGDGGTWTFLNVTSTASFY